MVKLSNHSINLLNNVIINYFKKRRKTKINKCFNGNFYFYESMRKYNQIRNCYKQHRILFIKSLTNTVCFLRNRRYPDWWEKIQRSSDNLWLKYLRMRRKTFSQLVSEIEPFIQKSNEISIEKQIALALIYLSSGKSQKYLGRLFSLPKIDIQPVINNVCFALKCLMPKYVKVPSTDEFTKNLSEFQTKWGFPQCAGVLGSMHVPLNLSKLPYNSADYFNSNSDYSILLQCIVDANYKFWDINVGWPGNVAESRVLTNSALWLRGQDRKLFPENIETYNGTEVPIYILAGAAYPLSHWILRPFLSDSESEKERLFNEKLTFAYNACEIAFKRLKARWNCLVTRNIGDIEALPTVVAACCVLHNYCENSKEPISDTWIVKSESFYKQPVPSVCSTVIGPQADSIRQAVSEHLITKF